MSDSDSDDDSSDSDDGIDAESSAPKAKRPKRESESAKVSAASVGVGVDQEEADADSDSEKEDGEIEEGELPEEGEVGDAKMADADASNSVPIPTPSTSNKRKRNAEDTSAAPSSRKKKQKSASSSSSSSQSRTREERHQMAGQAFSKNGVTYRYVEPLVGRELRSVPETMYKGAEQRGLKPRDLFRVRVRPKPRYTSDGGGVVDLRGELLKFCTSDELEKWNYELVAGQQVNHGLMAFQTIEEQEECLRRFYGDHVKLGGVPPWLGLKISLEVSISMVDAMSGAACVGFARCPCRVFVSFAFGLLVSAS